ncbi:MAG: hypothetical protein ACREYC_28390 [Gammaproteobacteria bacterium]
MLVRPALYEAWHVRQRTEASATATMSSGPVCGTADYLDLDRELAVRTGSFLRSCARAVTALL